MALKMKLQIKCWAHSSPSSAPHTDGFSGVSFPPHFPVRTTQRTFGGTACPCDQHLPFSCVPAAPRIWGHPGGWELSDVSGSYLTFYNSHTSWELTDDWWLHSLIYKARCPKDFALIKNLSLKSMNKPPENGADRARFCPGEVRNRVLEGITNN